MEALARQRGALSLMRLAKAREGQGDASDAIDAYARAAEASRAVGNGDLEAAAQLGVGRLRQASGDWDAAEAAYASALAAAGAGPMRRRPRLARRPAAVAQILRLLPPNHCYRQGHNRFPAPRTLCATDLPIAVVRDSRNFHRVSHC